MFSLVSSLSSFKASHNLTPIPMLIPPNFDFFVVKIIDLDLSVGSFIDPQHIHNCLVFKAFVLVTILKA